MNNFPIFIQARLGSSRLPGKVLLPLGEYNSLSLMERRLKQVFHAGQIIFLIPENDAENPLETFLIGGNYNFFRGSEEDVFLRFKMALLSLHVDAPFFVRLTGDCPFIEPKIILNGIEKFVEKDLDYLRTSPRMPEGLDFEVIRTKTFLGWPEESITKLERMHATYHLYNKRAVLNFADYDLGEDLSSYRITLDEQNDYELLSLITSHFSEEKSTVSWDCIKEFIDTHPELKKINSQNIRNEGLLLDERRIIK